MAIMHYVVQTHIARTVDFEVKERLTHRDDGKLVGELRRMSWRDGHGASTVVLALTPRRVDC